MGKYQAFISSVIHQYYKRKLTRYLSKFDFLSSGRVSINNAIKACLDGILASIRHLYLLNIIHNNITPSNIMFEEDSTPVINDFGSCRKVGTSL